LAASSNGSVSTRQEGLLRGDVIATLLYRLRLNRIRIEKDIRVQSDFMSANALTADHTHLQGAMFNTDQLLISAESLSQCKSREEFYLALQDVLANVVGAEHFALYERDEITAAWVPTVHCGVGHEQRLDCVKDRSFVTAIQMRDLVSVHSAKNPQAPVMFVPMLAGAEIEAVIVIFEWLPQKRSEGDRDCANVLEMLKVHGGAMLRNLALAGKKEG